MKCKISYFKGTNYEIGLSIGESLKGRLNDSIDEYIEIVNKNHKIDFRNLEKEATNWLNRLPSAYISEISGISRGANCSIEKIAKGYCCNNSLEGGCTSFIYFHNDIAWIGRNNDYIAPKKWGFVNVISTDGKIPVMLFGLEGDIFTGTGFNREKIWVHYNWLPVWDIPGNESNSITPFVFVRMILDNCKSISDIEYFLKNTTRDGGMNLFVVDGKCNEIGVYECTCTRYLKRRVVNNFIAGANHYCITSIPNENNFMFSDSIQRQSAMENLLKNVLTDDIHKSFSCILADGEVEQYNGSSGTVYANIACPFSNKLYYAFDGFPAASKSKWEEIKCLW